MAIANHRRAQGHAAAEIQVDDSVNQQQDRAEPLPEL